MIANNATLDLVRDLLDLHLVKWMAPTGLDQQRYVLPGANMLEEVVAHKSKDQVTLYTLGQAVLGGTAIALLRAWSVLEGGSFTIICGDSAYTFASSQIRECPQVPVEDEVGFGDAWVPERTAKPEYLIASNSYDRNLGVRW